MLEESQELEDSDVSEEITEESTEVVETEEIQDEKLKPESGFIDFDSLPEDHRDKVKMRIDGDYRKLKEQERKYEEAVKKQRDLESKLAELSKPKEVAPPGADDWYNDPDEAAKRQEAYADSVRQQAEWKYQNEQLERQRQAEFEQVRQQKVNELFQKSESAGIKQQDLINSASIVDRLLPAEMQDFVLNHEYAPQLINHLARNPVELQNVANLNPYQVGVKLEKMAQAFKPSRATKAPPPDEPIQGSGVDLQEEYGGLLKNAKFL